MSLPNLLPMKDLFSKMTARIPSQYSLMIGALLLAVVAGFAIRPMVPFALHLLLVLGVSFAGHAIWKRGIKMDVVFKDTLISALIITVLLEPAGTWMDAVPNALAAAFAVMLRVFGRYKGMPMVNPAASAVFNVTVLSMLGIISLPIASWWGANYTVNFMGNSLLVGTVVSVLLAFLVVTRLRKWVYAAAFFAVFAVGIWLTRGTDMLAYMLTDGTVFFFFGLMACEPKTAPVGKYAQIITGISLALALVAGLAWHLPAEYFLAIIVANAITMAWKRHPISKKYA